MTNVSSGRQRRGFTLAEVLVALGITAGSLILLLSANNESLRRSLRSRHAARMEQLCESKLDEISSGAERSRHGELAGMPGVTWDVDRSRAGVEGLEGLERVTLRVRGAAGNEIRTYTLFCYSGRSAKG